MQTVQSLALMLTLQRVQATYRLSFLTRSWRQLQPRCTQCQASTFQPTSFTEATRETTDREPFKRANPPKLPRSKSQSHLNPQKQSRIATSPSSALPTPKKAAAATTIIDTGVKPTKKTVARERGKQDLLPLERKSEKLPYPERLLIYHAGTGRTIFLSCTKLSGIFLFIFTGVFIAPAYYFSPMEPTYLAFVYLVGSCIPLALMTFTAAPFVTYVHLGLPAWARYSAARLQRYTQNLPSSAEIDVTSLRWIWPRVTRMNASELFFHKGSVTGALTLRREVPKHVQEARKWYSWRPIQKFYVGGKAGTKSAEPWAWQGVLEAIARGFPRSNVERRM